MRRIVQKYGETSLASTKLINKVAGYIKKRVSEGDKIVVIVSAMGDWTDQTIELINQVNQKPSCREYDQVLQTGEVITAGLMSMALEKIDIKAVSYTAAQLGLITSSDHGQAKIIRLNKPESLMKKMKDHVVVVAGFQGLAEDTGDITTLGRGGSDASAVAIAASIGASFCEIYTDVDGVYTIDPRIVPSAKRLHAINYEQMIAMAATGAGVLMDRCVKMAQSHNIPIKVLLSPSLGKSTGGTNVATLGETSNLEQIIYSASISINKGLGVINVSNIPNKPMQAAKIYGSIKEINIIDSAQGQGGDKAAISILVKEKDIEIIAARIKKISSIDVIMKKGLVALTLNDPIMRESAGFCWRITNVLGANEINVEMITTAQSAIVIVINEDDLINAANALADEFNLKD